MSIGQTVAAFLAVILLLAIFAYVDREQPDEYELDEEDEARQEMAREDED